MLKNVLLAGAAVVALAAVSVPARADSIVTNQWYTGSFTANPTTALSKPLLGGGTLGTNGPVLPGGVANAIATPTNGGGLLQAIITMPSGGYLTVTDVEQSGDQFLIYVNGVAATPYAYSQLSPAGQAGLGTGYTSVPTDGDTIGENISGALADSNFSSGTFYLPAGTDTITGYFEGTIASGSVDYIAEAPEPASLTILGLGMAGLGLMRRRRRS
jgi:hypothetical protein